MENCTLRVSTEFSNGEHQFVHLGSLAELLQTLNGGKCLLPRTRECLKEVWYPWMVLGAESWGLQTRGAVCWQWVSSLGDPSGSSDLCTSLSPSGKPEAAAEALLGARSLQPLSDSGEWGNEVSPELALGRERADCFVELFSP